MLLEKDSTCHRTCFRLYYEGNPLDQFTEIKNIPNIQDQVVFTVVEGMVFCIWFLLIDLLFQSLTILGKLELMFVIYERLFGLMTFLMLLMVLNLPHLLVFHKLLKLLMRTGNQQDLHYHQILQKYVQNLTVYLLIGFYRDVEKFLLNLSFRSIVITKTMEASLWLQTPSKQSDRFIFHLLIRRLGQEK